MPVYLTTTPYPLLKEEKVEGQAAIPPDGLASIEFIDGFADGDVEAAAAITSLVSDGNIGFAGPDSTLQGFEITSGELSGVPTSAGDSTSQGFEITFGAMGGVGYDRDGGVTVQGFELTGGELTTV